MARLPKLGDQREGAPADAESNVQGNETDVSDPETQGPESIAQRAYERFQTRGGEHGRDQEDWFDAERELKKDERG